MRDGNNHVRSHHREPLRPGGKRQAIAGPNGNRHDVVGRTDEITQLLREAVLDRFAGEKAATGPVRGPIDQAQGTSIAEGGIPSTQSDRQNQLDAMERPESWSAIFRWKRLLDLTVIFFTSPLWLPVMIMIMIAIKLGSPGPVFYRQERVGYRDRRFMIFKFRTMKMNVETEVHESHFERLMRTDSPMVKLDSKGDPRLIRFGHFLRAAGLDELPQIFNIWRGEMSLVGPRPCTVYEFERYQPWQRERVNAPPGLTGFWQVNGKNNTTFSEMIDMDILYGSNMSLRLDLLILVKTLPAVLEQLLASRGFHWSKCGRQAYSRAATPLTSSLFQ